MLYRIKQVSLAVMILGLLMVPYLALSQSQGSTAQATAGTLTSLNLSTSLIDFGALSLSDYSAGGKAVSPAQTVTLQSNKNWVLSIKADAATWTAPWAKPASELQFKSTSSHAKVTATVSSYTGTSTSDQQIAGGNKGNNITLSSHFNMVLAFENDDPGNYSLGITYTLTTP